jgi:phosphatidylglycerol phospholipase C
LQISYFQIPHLTIAQPNYLPLCAKYLPDYRTAHIGFSITYARQFLKEPRVDFNMLQKSMVGPFGNKFLRDIKAAGRSVFLWTVNDEEKTKWCIMKGVDGVITDDPLKFLDISKNYNGERCRLPVTQYGTAIWINIMSTIFGFMFRLRAMSSRGKGDQSR